MICNVFRYFGRTRLTECTCVVNDTQLKALAGFLTETAVTSLTGDQTAMPDLLLEALIS